MRATAFLLFVLAVPARAEDTVDGALRALEAARPRLLQPGAPARVLPPVERLLASGSPRAFKPLVAVLLDTFAGEAATFARMKQEQQRGANAFERVQALDKEIAHLKLRLDAGAADVGPALDKRIEERRLAEKTFEDVKDEVDRLGRTVEFVRELRATVVAGLPAMLAGYEAAERGAGFAHLRERLDVAARAPSLLLVSILRNADTTDAAPHLREILVHPKVPDPTRRAAAAALAHLRDAEGLEAVLRLARADPDGFGRHALHSCGLAAGKRLATIDAAQAWVASLR